MITDRGIAVRAEFYAYGQTAGRTGVGSQADEPDFAWVDETAFIAAAVDTDARLITSLRDLYDRMLAEGTHVYRFTSGGSSVQRPGGS